MREKNVLKNIITKLLGTGIATILSFVSKKIFVNSLGDEILGLNSLLISVLSMLSLLELGIGSAIYFSLYKPLAEKDEEQTSAIMHLYARIYMCIGVAVFIVGVALMPFVYFFVKTSISSRIVYMAYFAMLCDTSLSYYMAYRRNIFSADQKEYFNTNVDTVINITVTCLQMIAVVLTSNYFFYLGIKIAGTISGNAYIYYNSGKKYPYIKKKSNYKLSKEFKDTFIKNVKALCVVNLSVYLVFGTDNLLISKFTDLKAVFIYSNYTAILMAVNNVFHKPFSSLNASVGNYIVLEGKEKTYQLFKKIYFLNFLVTSYTSVALITLYNDAIKLWMGKERTWPLLIVAVLVFNNYSRYILQALETFRAAAGLYSPYPTFKFLTLLEGVTNLVASLFFIVICKLGVLGVFLGTSVSTLVSTLAIPHALYHYYFNLGLKDYVKRYLQYLGLTIGYSVLSVGILHCLHTQYVIINIAIGLVLSFVIPFGFTSLIFRKTDEYQYAWNLFLKYINKFAGKITEGKAK